MNQLNNETEPKYLQNLLDNLFPDDKYSICIQDTSGILHTIPSLNIDYKYRAHTSPICVAAKLTSKGLNHCAKIKTYSLKTFSENTRAYVCRCHLGLIDITVPVFNGNKLACAIYIGSFILKGTKNETLRRLEKYSPRFGARINDFISALEETTEIDENDFLNIQNLAESIAQYIRLLIEKSHVRIIATSSKSRVNKSTSEGAHWAVAYIMEYVDFNYNHDIHLPNIAKLLFLNPDYLCRIFRKHTGQHFIDYVNAKRISEARRIMEQSKASITEICYDVGFKNKSHFNRVFKKLCKATPSDYKKELNKKSIRGL